MGKMAIASLSRKATEAAASFPSTVMCLVMMIASSHSHLASAGCDKLKIFKGNRLNGFPTARREITWLKPGVNVREF
jgi:hypothetical protein